MKDQSHRAQRRPLAGWGLFALVGVLLCFGALNIAVRATSHKLEDGVLWEARPEGVTAATLRRAAAPWRRASGPGDVIVGIDGAPVRDGRGHPGRARSARPVTISCPYTVLRLGEQQMLNVEVAPVPTGQSNALCHRARRSASSRSLSVRPVRLRRPDDPATLHFFWLCLAFFGTLTFSFSRLDRLDWYFYWADVVATLLLAPLFLHFTLAFPDRPARGCVDRGSGSSRCCTHQPPRCSPRTW
jgi:hypothetical protein